MVQKMVPEHFHRNMKDMLWTKNLLNLKAPAHFHHLVEYSRLRHIYPSEEINSYKKHMPVWNLIYTYFEYLDSILSLLPAEMSQYLMDNYKLDQISAYLKTQAQRLHLENSVEVKPSSTSMLIISVLQLTAANHSLSFLMMFRYIHNEICLKALASSKSKLIAKRYHWEENNSGFEKLFELPIYYTLPYEDLLQSIRMVDLAHLLVTNALEQDAIIANGITSPSNNLDC